MRLRLIDTLLRLSATWDSKISSKAQLRNALFATVNQMFGGSSQLVTTYRARGNQIVEHNSDNETVLGSSRKLGGAAERLTSASEKRIYRLSFEV